MKILPLGLIALLSPVLIFSQEVKVKGQVIIHNTKQGVYPAQIKSNAKDFTSISTNSQGDFELPFADTDIGKDIELVIEYPGYEVVNKEVLTINIPKPKFQTKKLEIYLCKIGEWEQNFARLNNLHFKWLADAHQKKLNDLKKQLKINKSKAENSQEAIKILTQQYENQKKIIENLSQQFAKTHLPNKTESFKAAYKLFEQGTPENLKNAIKLLESDENDAKAFKNKAWNEMYIEEQLLVAKIYSVLSDTAKAEATYIKILNIDPTSPEALYQYGNYLQEHDKQSAAIEQYEKVLTLVDNELRKFQDYTTTMDIRVNLGYAYLSIGNHQAAKVYFSRCLEFSEFLNSYSPRHKAGNLYWFGLAKVYKASCQLDSAELCLVKIINNSSAYLDDIEETSSENKKIALLVHQALNN